VLNTSFEIGKVLINFVAYDETCPIGSRKKTEIPIYIDIEKFFVLKQDVMSGRMSGLAKRAKELVAQEQEKIKKAGQDKKIYANHIWLDQGGIPADRLKERGKARPDGKSLARQLKLTPGEKMPWVLSAETGAGEESETGLIIPKYSRPEEILRVPLANDDIKKLLLITEAHISAFIVSQYYVRAMVGTPKVESNRKTA
jgi:hypothetical protein